MPPKSTRKKITNSTSTKEVIVRMYDVGFGDSFLLFIPTSDGIRKVLFDCGSIAAGVQPLKQVAQQIIQDAMEPDGVSRIHVVVCTHRHRDHVAGFDNPLWKDVEVSEVWMPWTEDPDDADAKRIRETQAGLALALQQHFARSAEQKVKTSAVDPAPYQALALNALSNEGAMDMLHSGFALGTSPLYLPKKDSTESIYRTPVLPGVMVYVLGPSRDEEIIRDMDPPAGESYLRLVNGLKEAAASGSGPFSKSSRVSEARYPADLRLPREFCTAVENTGTGLEPAVAVALEKAVNGTSLMLVLQIGSAYLLFPGDAQWGTWNQALTNWKDLLQKTSFYKVGHHGSHNATPVDFVEKVVGTDFYAMVSTRHVKQWPRIPKKELMTAIEKKTKKLIRSDEIATASATYFVALSDKCVDAHVPI